MPLDLHDSCFRNDYRLVKFCIICSHTRTVLNVQKVQSVKVPPHFVCSGYALGKLSFSKQKLSQSASIELQIAMNIFYILMMQCLHCLRNVHDRITLLICRQIISC